LRNSRSPIEQRYPEELEGVESNLMLPLVKMVKQEGHFGLEKEATLISRLTSSSLKANQIWITSWICFKPLRLFDYKDISEGKKVKLVALKLRKYASIW